MLSCMYCLLWYQPYRRLRRLFFQHLNLKLWGFSPCPPNRPPDPLSNATENYLFAASRQAQRNGPTDWTVFLLRRWSLPNPEYYTLRYADGPQLYITEQVGTGRRTGVQAFLCGEPPRGPMLFTSLPSVASTCGERVPSGARGSASPCSPRTAGTPWLLLPESPGRWNRGSEGLCQETSRRRRPD